MLCASNLRKFHAKIYAFIKKKILFFLFLSFLSYGVESKFFFPVFFFNCFNGTRVFTKQIRGRMMRALQFYEMKFYIMKLWKGREGVGVRVRLSKLQESPRRIQMWTRNFLGFHVKYPCEPGRMVDTFFYPYTQAQFVEENVKEKKKMGEEGGRIQLRLDIKGRGQNKTGYTAIRCVKRGLLALSRVTTKFSLRILTILKKMARTDGRTNRRQSHLKRLYTRQMDIFNGSCSTI